MKMRTIAEAKQAMDVFRVGAHRALHEATGGTAEIVAILPVYADDDMRVFVWDRRPGRDSVSIQVSLESPDWEDFKVKVQAIL